MSELNNRSLRLLVDMQACQTEGSGPRGVGRYSHALFSSLLAGAKQHDIYVHLSNDLHIPFKLNSLPESRILRSPAFPNWNAGRDFRGGEQDTLDALSLSAFLAPAKADILHVSHVFEGFSDRVALPSQSCKIPGQILSATLYDLIPLLFQKHYFHDEGFRKWYKARLAWLQKCDLLLAISESSRQDAIALLGIEPWRIVTIHGGISPHFSPGEDDQSARRDLTARYGLRERFVLYTGGDDHRKNLRGAIGGFAAVSADLRKNCQLVIVCSMSDERKQMYINEALSAGLSSKDLVFTGFVSEEDLVSFYRTCDLFVFPSLYEGLGLPVLEAMACGAPVIGGNNSSIKELIARPDALFDASSSQSIGAAIAKALSNKDCLMQLRDYGLSRSKEFTWEKTAQLALNAFDEASKRSRESGIKAAVQGWLPRKRLAIFTPLPPCRSGIADYNARFLPFLSKYFDIDLYVDDYKVIDEVLTSSFRIYSAKDFESVASQYDAILYEFGNSEFHAHMLPILERHPGVVGLHDAYLSGLFGYIDFNLGATGSYAGEMLSAHGSGARRLFAPVQKHPNAIGESMIQLPCTKKVIDQAIGVISHSPFNLEVARSAYPEGWQAPYRIIPQMVSIPPAWTRTQRETARSELGFMRDDIIISTFGHIAWTKWGDRLLDAFLVSKLRANKKVHLVFAGELAQDDFGDRLKLAIQKSGLKDRICVTGFLSEQDYERYLRISDIAVQLRTKSRGGTPKGVLDCLAYGVPVAVNDDASYRDYPDDVVIKLPTEPSVDEIAEKLDSLLLNPGHRKNFSDSGLRYVTEHHDPTVCAAAYAAAINEFVGRRDETKIKQQIALFAPHLAACVPQTEAIQLAVDWLSNLPNPSFGRRRLIVDVSYIAKQDNQTGIPRVVKEIVRAMYCSEQNSIEPVAVELINDNLQVAEGWLHSQELLLPADIEHLKSNSKIEFRPGDVFIMLDSSWARYREFFPIFEKAKLSFVPIYTVVYDLLPLTLPPGNIVAGGKEWFTGWLEDAIEASDGLICISKSAAVELSNYLDSRNELNVRPKIGYWHLGSDFVAPANVGAPNPEVEKIASHPFLLMVGTIDPRKSHALALAAMENLWEQGHELCLCIAGKEGWMVDELMTSMRSHPLLGRKLFLFESPSDGDIHFLYSNAKALLFVSKGEGFGLPIVEAANNGLPIICSDIPVFREIAGEYATYVDIKEPIILADSLRAWWKKLIAKELPDTRMMPRLTWEESGKEFMGFSGDINWIKGNS